VGEGGAADHARRPEFADLTRRELEVLGLIADGLTNREIGDRLVVSARTVQAHVGSMIHKTGTANRTHLAVTAVRTGLIK
jgi:DNA-binding NarL/FixJ family response regulator